MSISLRTEDMKGEQIVKEYLIRYFYEPIKNNNILENIYDYRAINDYEQQINGIDTICYTINGQELKIDEKCALSYINKNLSTFAFELLWHRNGEEKDGWLINNNLQTQYYFIMWLNGIDIRDKNTGELLEKYDYIKKMTVDHINHIELFVIHKKLLIEYLAKIGLSAESMKNKAREMIANNKTRDIVNQDIDIWYVYSNKLAEKPVNLIISKELLKKIANPIFEIEPNQIKRNKKTIFSI